VTHDDLAALRARVFGACNGPDIMDEKWKTAVFITPRNIIRQAWNHQAALRHHLQTGEQIFISPAIDKDIPSQYIDRVIWETDANTEMLATWNILCINGPSVGTANLGVELGIANGTQGIVKEVVPHPADDIGWHQAGEKPIVFLTRPPICVWIEPTSSNIEPYFFTSIADRRTWFPIFPLETEVTIRKAKITFKWAQIPLTPGNISILESSY